MQHINYSIIIPHKNSASLLQYCLNSIPIRDDVQVIVVDDNSDADKVDTSKAGVHTVTMTATYGESSTSTTVSVVIAPKYERTWANGKVATLKAYHLNGNLYAYYVYDWANKTAKVTFYEQDGETVAETTVMPLA